MYLMLMPQLETETLEETKQKGRGGGKNTGGKGTLDEARWNKVRERQE